MTNTPTVQEQLRDYRRVEAAIRYLEANFRRQPSLDEIADAVHLSKYHFQRLFKRWAGVSPTQFTHFLTVEYAKGRLAEASTVFDAALDAGLSGGGRLHDLFVTFEAMTPGEYKRQASGLTIRYGAHPTPFGVCVLAVTERGICALRFVEEGTDATVAQLQAEWPGAEWIRSDSATAPVIDTVFVPGRATRPLPLLLRGTNFQTQVWRALLRIQPGDLVTYSDVAAGIGRKSATRAVAGAIAANPIGYLIPCHRVISKVGRAHQYRWGSARKKAIIGYEAAHSSGQDLI